MEDQKYEGDSGVTGNETIDTGWDHEDPDDRHLQLPQEVIGDADTAENVEGSIESPYHGWDEPFEIAIEDVHLGGEENVGSVAAGGRPPRLKLGATSRIILEPEQPTRLQPLKMKKGKKEQLTEDESKPSLAKSSSDIKKKGAKDESKESLGKKMKKVKIGNIKKFWTTADVLRDTEPESYVIFSMRDFVLYLIFLIITATIAFGSLAYAYNYYGNVVSELLTNSRFKTEIGGEKTFRDIHRIEDIWIFLNTSLFSLIYSDPIALRNRTPTTRDPVTEHGAIRVLLENILVGAPRIRQVRVKSGTCTSAKMFEDAYVSCYDYYYDDIQDKNNFGKGPAAAFRYIPPKGYNFHYSGAVSSYGEGGFSMNFSTDPDYTRKSLQTMKDNTWIQIGTRAVFVDFTLYSPNANLFCVVKLVFEIIPTGGVIASSNIYTLKLLRYLTKWDFFIAGCEVVFLLFAIYYLAEEMQHMKVLKEYYLTNWWNILDLLIVLSSFLVIALNIAIFLTVYTTLPSKVRTVHTTEHSSFEFLSRIQNGFNVSASVLTFLVWLKLVKFSSLNRSVSLIISTFGRVKLELVALVFMMIAVIMGFALLGNALFGSQIIQFRTVNDSFFTLLGLFIGGLYFFDKCRQSAKFAAQIFFGLYIFFVLVIFFSAFVALIVFGFHKVVNDIEGIKNHVYVGDLCNQLCMKILTILRRKKLADKLQARQLAQLYMKDYDALVNIIRRHGYRGIDLALLLKKHKVKPGEPISLETMSTLYNDLTTRNQLYMEVEEHDKIMEHIDKINKTIEFLDLTLADIVSKVDILANKLVAGRR